MVDQVNGTNGAQGVQAAKPSSLDKLKQAAAEHKKLERELTDALNGKACASGDDKACNELQSSLKAQIEATEVELKTYQKQLNPDDSTKQAPKFYGEG